MFANDSLSCNAKGGTELMKERLEKYISKDLLDNFQIFCSRVHEPFDETKLRIYWAHDLAEDGESMVLNNNGHENFHKLVFVSNWQMQRFIERYNLPWEKCIVLHNAIEPFENGILKPTDKINLVYASTPHRGLNILWAVFKKLSETNKNIHLNVLSSFKLYGDSWASRDEPYKQIFEEIEEHPQATYHGSQDNDYVRDIMRSSHILAYPSTWQETGCLVLMESMAAGLLCIHSNLGALYETAANWNVMYQYTEDQNKHANLFHHILENSINNLNDDGVQERIKSSSLYANAFYSWDSRKYQWESLLNSMLDLPREIPKKKFVYNVN